MQFQSVPSYKDVIRHRDMSYLQVTTRSRGRPVGMTITSHRHSGRGSKPRFITYQKRTAMTQTESEAPRRTSPDDEDELLRERVGTCIAEFCGGDMPDGVAVHVVERRVTITGQVEDADIAQRIEKAASTPPGILGVSNQLTTRVPAPR